jgi:mRNA interferase MazF
VGKFGYANLNPAQKVLRQAGIRPIIIFQNDIVSQFSTTTIAIPLTTNRRRASLPICMLIRQGDGGSSQDSVALCFQIRVLDKTRLIQRLGLLRTENNSSTRRCRVGSIGIPTMRIVPITALCRVQKPAGNAPE